MTRFSGEIGYAEDNVEDPPDSGIFVNRMVEHSYYGDVIRDIRRLEIGESINGDISMQNSISVVADAYATENYLSMRYIRWAGTLWTVTSVDVRSPRLILALGSRYNGPTI